MTKEHKEKISIANKGKSRNKGKIWITNGFHITRIYKDDLSQWQEKGYLQGKKLVNKPQVAWNKGLTKNDPRVKSYLNKRNSKVN